MAFHTSEIEKFKKNRRWSEVTRLGDCIEGKGFRIDKDGNFVDVPEAFVDLDSICRICQTSCPYSEELKQQIDPKFGERLHA